MFIAQLKNGKQITGDSATWDDVQNDPENHVTALHLTLPFKANMKNQATGVLEPMPARTVSLGIFNRYYTAKEAVTRFGARSEEANVVAEIMGGIDDRTGLVVEVRVAKDGNITMRNFPVSQLPHAEHALKAGKPLKK